MSKVTVYFIGGEKKAFEVNEQDRSALLAAVDRNGTVQLKLSDTALRVVNGAAIMYIDVDLGAPVDPPVEPAPDVASETASDNAAEPPTDSKTSAKK